MPNGETAVKLDAHIAHDQHIHQLLNDDIKELKDDVHEMNDKITTIDKKIAYFAGGVSTFVALVEVIGRLVG